MKRKRVLCSIGIAVLLTGLLTACSSTPRAVRTLAPAEADLETGGETGQLYHSVLYYPAEIALQYPGYLIGIEKSPHKRVLRNGDLVKRPLADGGERLLELQEKLGGDTKIHIVSHVVENFGRPLGEGNCALYNSYFRSNATAQERPIDFCPGQTELAVAPATAYVSSWVAMERLQRELAAKLKSGRYSHVLVLTMGWNTPQYEAVRNFNSIVRNLVAEAAAEKQDFRPLVIGVTWASQWESSWLAPLYQGVSYTNKANDADEVGLSWLGVLLHDVVAPVRNNVPVVVIGHSFGARAASMASCVGPGIAGPLTGDAGPAPIDLFVGLQGAFSIHRFLPNHGKEKLHYPGGCENVKTVALTASSNDTAMDSGFWADMAGNDRSYRMMCRGDERTAEVTCTDVNESGLIAATPAPDAHRLLYLEADSLVKFNAYATGGDAHSDIYRPEMGRMLWQLVQTYSPGAAVQKPGDGAACPEECLNNPACQADKVEGAR